MPGTPAKSKARFSIGTRNHKMLSDAAPIPTLWMARQKFRKGDCRAAFTRTAPTMEPNTIVSETFQSSSR
jgi:hypothetical protein